MAETGPFVWHELRVPDLEEAERFYGAVFGWAFTDNPMGRSITHRGVVIGGAGAALEGAHGVPSSPCADGDAAARARTATRRPVRGRRRGGPCADGDAAARARMATRRRVRGWRRGGARGAAVTTGQAADVPGRGESAFSPR